MVYPNSLKKGDTIGIVAPSGGANLEYIDYAIQNLNSLGLNVIEGKTIRNMECLVSASAKRRASELIEFFLNKNIKYIFSARGGEFLIDILPFIHDKKEVFEDKNNLKYFHGYSDNSLLNVYLTTNFFIPTVNSLTVTEFCMKEFDESIKNNLDFMFLNEDKEFKQKNFEKYQIKEFEDKRDGFNLTEKVQYKLLNLNNKKIQIKGRLIGGCLETIVQLIGTKFDNVKNFCKSQKEGIIWYFDIYEDNAPEVYRKINHMKNAGWFENIKGILIGRTYGGKALGDFDLHYAYEKALGNLEVPVIYDVDIGHVPPQLVLVNGSLASVIFDNENFEIKQEFI